MGCVCCPGHCYAPAVASKKNTETKYLESVLDRDPRLCVLGMEDEKGAVDIMATAFGGTKDLSAEGMTKWTLGPSVPQGDPRLTEIATYNMRFAFVQCVKYGVVFGVKDPTDSKLLAVAGCLPPGVVRDGVSMPHCTFCSVFCCNLGCAMPAHMGSKEEEYPAAGMKLRDAASWKAMEECHAHAKEPHWYVFVVAVAPEARGKKCGSALMRHINKLADLSGDVCYLETADEHNVAIYRHFGYSQEWRIGPIGDEKMFEGEGKVMELTFVAMKRPAGSPESPGKSAEPPAYNGANSDNSEEAEMKSAPLLPGTTSS